MAAVALLASCGQKGPLLLPSRATGAVSPPATVASAASRP